MPRLLAVPLAVLCLACQSRPQPRAPAVDQIEHRRSLAAVAELPRCGDAAPASASWPRHDHRFFSFQLPPEYDLVERTPLDSYARYYEAPGRRFSLDFGMYSNSLAEPGGEQRDRRACRATVDGRMVRLVTARDADGTYVAGAAWRDLEPGLHLTLYARSATAAGQQAALAAFRSIDFREPLGGR